MDRLFRLLLLAYPAAFRIRYGQEVVDVLRRTWHEAGRGAQRPWALVRISVDAVANGIAMRWESRRRGGRDRNDDGRGDGWMGEFRQDLAYAWTTFRRRPGLTLVALATLAIGIGGNTLIFSVVEAVLLRPLPFDDPDRVVRLSREYRTDDGPAFNPSYSEPAFVALDRGNQAFDAIAAVGFFPALAGDLEEPFRVQVMPATAGIWATLGITPQLGRAFTTEEDRPGAAAVAVIGTELWRDRFDGSPAVLGSALRIGARTFTVIGVLPEGVSVGNNNADVWVPMAIDPGNWNEDAAINNNRVVYARLSSEVAGGAEGPVTQTLQSARAAAPEAFGEDEALRWMSVSEAQVGDVRATLLMLFGAVGLVLLVACANLANLLLVQAQSRRSEFAVRAALGAGQGRLVRQLLTESTVLAVVGSAAGVALAWFGLDLLKALAPAGIPRLDEAGLSAGVLGFTMVLGIATGLVFGLAPALAALRSGLRSSLTDSARGGGGRSGGFRNALVVSEVALTVVLMVGAGLLVNSLLRLQEVDLGFEAENRWTAGLLVPPGAITEPAQARDILARIEARAEAIPGVRNAEYAWASPIGGQSNWWVEIEGRTDEGVQFPDYNLVAPGYFELMEIPLLEGRVFDSRDEVGDVPTVIISKTTADRLFPDGNAVGQRLNMNMPPDRVWREIVGVVGDVRGRAASEAPRMQMYVPPVFAPFANPGFGGTLVLELDDRAPGLAEGLRSVLAAELPGSALGRIRSVDEAVRGSEVQRRFVASLLIAFAGAALLLSVVGLYGVVSHTVAARTREFGLRMALGASPQQVLSRVLRYGLLMAGAGAVIGLVGAVWLSSLLEGLLFEIAALDPLTYVAVAGLLGGVALVTSLLPARRATLIPPTRALNCD